MRRRTFFRWTLSSAVLQLLPRWAFARQAPTADSSATTLHAVAATVLPASLPADRLARAVGQFETWVREYEAGVAMSAGYGITRLRVVGPDPSAHYDQQLRDLEQAAQARGTSFSALDRETRTALVTAAIDAAGVDNLPRRPDGRHVAVDLMSHFFFVDDEGHDWLYAAAIERTKCRGLASSDARPPRLR